MNWDEMTKDCNMGFTEIHAAVTEFSRGNPMLGAFMAAHYTAANMMEQGFSRTSFLAMLGQAWDNMDEAEEITQLS